MFTSYQPCNLMLVSSKAIEGATINQAFQTSNNLYDPYQKRPIIIVPMKYFDSEKYLLVPYHTASSSSLLKCVKPRSVTIDGRIIHNVLVGFSSNIHLPDGVEVILHKDLMRGERNV